MGWAPAPLRESKSEPKWAQHIGKDAQCLLSLWRDRCINTCDIWYSERQICGFYSWFVNRQNLHFHLLATLHPIRHRKFIRLPLVFRHKPSPLAYLPDVYAISQIRRKIILLHSKFKKLQHFSPKYSQNKSHNSSVMTIMQYLMEIPGGTKVLLILMCRWLG